MKLILSISSILSFIPETIDIFLLAFASIQFAYELLLNFAKSHPESSLDNHVYIRDPYEVKEENGTYYAYDPHGEKYMKEEITKQDFDSYNNYWKYVKCYKPYLNKYHALTALVLLLFGSFFQIKRATPSLCIALGLMIIYIIAGFVLYHILIMVKKHIFKVPQKTPHLLEIEDKYFTLKNKD